MDTELKARKPIPLPLPTTQEQWLADRKVERTLNDLVEEVHKRLVEDEQYIAFLFATWDEQAVEGSLAADNLMAASVIRDLARKEDIAIVKDQKLATIAKSLNIVLRRYGKSRKERRNTVGGEIVPPEINNGD